MFNIRFTSTLGSSDGQFYAAVDEVPRVGERINWPTGGGGPVDSIEWTSSEIEVDGLRGLKLQAEIYVLLDT